MDVSSRQNSKHGNGGALADRDVNHVSDDVEPTNTVVPKLNPSKIEEAASAHPFKVAIPPTPKHVTMVRTSSPSPLKDDSTETPRGQPSSEPSFQTPEADRDEERSEATPPLK
nr:hypothetical protein [Pirellula sp.]